MFSILNTLQFVVGQSHEGGGGCCQSYASVSNFNRQCEQSKYDTWKEVVRSKNNGWIYDLDSLRLAYNAHHLFLE